jgi:hypothetical protein
LINAKNYLAVILNQTMAAFTIKKCNQKVLIVGPLYDKFEKILKIKQIQDNYQFIIFNGNISYPFISNEDLESKIDILDQNSNWIFNVGKHDLKILLNTQLSNKIKTWISNKPNVIIIEFINKTNLIVLDGGILPSFSKTDLLDNLEVTFVSHFNNESWHKSYGGSYGYVISNNPLNNGNPEFYNYSMQLGNTYDSGKIYAQEADEYGLKETILL